FLSLPPRPPLPTLFPYTTLFRSIGSQRSALALAVTRGRAAKPRASRTASSPRRARRPSRTARARCPAGPSAPTTRRRAARATARSEEHTSELQSRSDLVCRLLLE